MAQVIYRGSGKDWFEKNMGRGGAIPLGKKPVSEPQTSSEKPVHLADSLEEFDSQLRQEILEQWGASPSVPQEWVDQIFQEAKESGNVAFPSEEADTEGFRSMINMVVIAAYKRGDRVGSIFESGTPFQPVNEPMLQVALKNIHGTDESSIVDCFLAYTERHPWDGNQDSWLWGWLEYHQKHHGRGYGRTMRDHFTLIKYLLKRCGHLSIQENLAKVQEIAADANSFGNGSLCLVYPLYQYAKANITEMEARDVVLLFTRCTHTNQDAIRAVNLLMDIIDGVHVEPPTEAYIRENCFAEHATAYNTLLTALFIADVETEMDVIRRGVWVSGDTDSTLATAMLLWALKRRIL